jgi:hypothetical protein
MKNKNTFLTLVAFLTLGFGVCHGAAHEEVKSGSKTIASVTKFLQEEFERLEKQLEVLPKIKEENPVVKGHMDFSISTVEENLRALAAHGAKEFQALTGLIPEEMRVNRDFHENILREYQEGLRLFLEIKKSSEENEGFINLVRQRVEYYGNIMDIYAKDSESFSLRYGPLLRALWGDMSPNIYLKDASVVFLTIPVEEEKDAAVALSLLNKISKLSGGNPYRIYSSLSLCSAREKVKGELSPKALQDFLEEEGRKIIEEEWETVAIEKEELVSAPELKESVPEGEETPSLPEIERERVEAVTLEIVSVEKKLGRRARRNRAKKAALQEKVVVSEVKS